jgi:hypothetical protein
MTASRSFFPTAPVVYGLSEPGIPLLTIHGNLIKINTVKTGQVFFSFNLQILFKKPHIRILLADTIRLPEYRGYFARNSVIPCVACIFIGK